MTLEAARLISGVSGGRALQGLWPKDPQSSVGDDHHVEELSRQMLLKAPPSSEEGEAWCIHNTDQCTSFKTFYFEGTEQAERLKKCIKEKGWSTGIGLYTSFCLGEATYTYEGMEVSEQRLSNEVSQAYKISFMYMPVNCFRISRNQMVLSNSAVQRAVKIRDSAHADDFLRSFGPFVSESLYQLGGVFCSESTWQVSNRVSDSTFGRITNRMGKSVLSANVVDVPAKASVEMRKSKGIYSVAGFYEESRTGAEQTVVLGPPSAANVDEFKQKLLEDPYCRAIIDKGRDGSNSLVSVWDLLIQPATLASVGDVQNGAMRLKEAARKLCERWLEFANARLLPASVGEEEECYIELINQSRQFLDKLSPDPSLEIHYKALPPAPPSNLPERRTDVLQELKQVLLEADDAANQKYITQRVSLILRAHSSPENLAVFRQYGFHQDTNDWDSDLNRETLSSIIEDLREAERGREHDQELSLLPGGSTWNLVDWMEDSPVTSEKEAFSKSCCHAFSYFGDVLADRSLHADNKEFAFIQSERSLANAHLQDNRHRAAARQLIDCLRHRLDPLKYLPFSPSSAEGPEAIDSSDSEPEEVEGVSKLQVYHVLVPHFGLLIEIIRSSDLSTQIAVCDLLLSQRSAIPLIFPQLQEAAASKQGKAALVQYMELLQFVTVNLENEQKVCIANDTWLPRVVFMSNRKVNESHAGILASRVLNCNFMSQHDREWMTQVTDEAPAMEIGVGFIRRSPGGSHNKNKCDYFPCVSILITGKVGCLMEVVAKIADMIVLEVSEGNVQAPPISAKLVRWHETGTDVIPRYDKPSQMVCGQETFIVKKVGRFLEKAIAKNMNAEKPVEKRPSIVEVCREDKLLSPGHPDLHGWEEPLLRMLADCQSLPIEEQIRLQRSFQVEAKAFLASLSNPEKKQEMDRARAKERKSRKRQAETATETPLITLFLRVLKQNSSTLRRFGITWLERSLSEKIQTRLDSASERTVSTFQSLNTDVRYQADTVYHEANLHNASVSVGLQNLWRELCHIYEADPDSRRALARLAAQHLLDGLPLEILDGEACMYCKIWVASVLAELEAIVGKAGKPSRIFVLSVMGMQSSGKSTMLNYMFGTRMRTGAGRCTTGVYIQLVPSEQSEYDYVLLLDTEGLRSPMSTGKESAVRDNWLATFGLLPADASLFMVCNEDDGGLKDVLPMVLLAFKGSAIAEKYNNRIKAKLIFVYRSVDTNGKSKLKGNTKMLQEHLTKAAQAVVQMGSTLSASNVARESNLPSQEMKDEDFILSDFRVTDVEEESDVKFMGNLKCGSKPPDDTPDWHYGESVMALREYLHCRVVRDSGGWKASSFTELAQRLSLAWDCICDADFELSFIRSVEYASYIELQNSLQQQRIAVSDMYEEAFKDMESKDLGEAGVEHLDESSISQQGDSLLKGAVSKHTEEVEKILDMKKRWKVEELNNWKRFLDDSKDWYTARMTDLRERLLRCDEGLTQYRQQCKALLVQEFERDPRSSSGQSDEARHMKFEEIYKEILSEAQKKHSPIAASVREKINKLYIENKLGNVINFDPQGYMRGVGELQSGMMSCLPFSGSNLGSTATVRPEGGSYSRKDGLFTDGTAGCRSSVDMVIAPWTRTCKFSEGGIASSDYPIYQQLESMVERHLRDATQYSDGIVRNVITSTKQILEPPNRSGSSSSRTKQLMAHKRVYEKLTTELKIIQEKWDQKYNVVEKLMSKEIKDDLEKYFADLCEGLEATALLVNQLQRILENKALKDVHRIDMISYVRKKVQQQAWMRDWRTMRNILDYHLLILMKVGKETEEKLIKYATDGPSHFRLVINALVGQAITRRKLDTMWAERIEKVQGCLRTTAKEHSKKASVKGFLGALRRRLADGVDKSLANAVMNGVHLKGSDDSTKLDGELFEKKLPELCESIKMIEKPDFELMVADVTEAVLEEMAKLPDEALRPRCDLKCPTCGSICRHAKGHKGTKHDTTHQPGGLGGNIWSPTNDLVETTCPDLCKMKLNILLSDDGSTQRRSVPYQKFEKEYPDWNKPSSEPSSSHATAVKVRECLFYNYQRQLAEYWNCKPCEQMPRSYDHDHDVLRGELFTDLRPHFPRFASFKKLLETL